MNILQEARARQGISRLQMAINLGLGEHTIYQYEASKRMLRASDILKVAKAYGLSDEEIILYLKQVAR